MAASMDEMDDSAISNHELDPHTRNVLDRQLEGLAPDTQQRKLSVLSFATSWDIAVVSMSSIMAAAAGAANPLLTVIFGQLAGIFTGFAQGSISGSELRDKTADFALYYVYLAIGEFVLIYISTVGFYYSGERIAQKLRRAYLSATITQNIAYFDKLGTGTVTTHITSDMSVIHETIASKLPTALTAAANFASAFIIAFTMYWKLALVLSSVIVVMLIFSYITSPYAARHSKISQGFYRNGSNVAGEAISSIRHVTAFGTQNHLAEIYHNFLRDAERSGVRSRIAIALFIAWCNAMPCFVYALGFYAGTQFLVKGETSISALMSAILAIANGAFAVVRVIPTAESFVHGLSSANSVLKAISRRSPQDPFSKEGASPASAEGNIDLEQVELIYPSRPDVLVLKGLDIHISAMKKTAFVGLSGCGKSSIFGLLERFYEPTAGIIKLDGRDIQNLNLRWLRNQMAYVGQEPRLFSTTIRENISHGLANAGLQENDEQTFEHIVAAAKLANAHDFISALPDGYDTEVGEHGLSMSGGQRQRIAIARAIISNPRILLLDEATSALDTTSERVVQQALDSAARDRTTIIIAHRLSTIKDADHIIVMSDGKVIEQGTHVDLMGLEGAYAALVQKQQITCQSPGTEDGESVANIQSEKVEMRVGETDTIRDVQGRTPDEEKGLDAKAMDERSLKPGLWLTIKLILTLNRDETKYLIGGLSCSILAAFGLPLQGVFTAEVLNSFSTPSDQSQKLNRDINFWCLMFTVVGIYSFLVTLGNGICFAYSTERLAYRVRDQCLRHILRQTPGYFDDKAHSTGDMTAMLTASATNLIGLGGAVLGSILTFTFTIVTAMILSLAVGWKLALVCTAMMPLVAGLGWARLQCISIFDSKIRQSSQRAAAYASEAVQAIRTVAAAGIEKYVMDKYRDVQLEQAAKSLPAILQTSALYAASQSIGFLAAALVFWYGSTLIASHEYNLTQFFICFVALIWGSQIAGALFVFAPDMSKATYSAYDIKTLFDRKPEVDTWNDEGERIQAGSVTGHVRLEDVRFKYPTRPDQTVLHGINLDIPAGQFIGLVGTSGCGKSTILSLIERFYTCQGRITLDGRDISSINVRDYRRLFSLVGQEPTIYSGTIKENLIMGLESPPSDESVVQACKDANIYDFITSLPDAFETTVGSNGSMLSGGQKQRISIARALLRNPSILLLDEATSALDSQSEHLVQEALDKASNSRTTIAIAHRLSTVKKADVIYVLDAGRVIEQGSHQALMTKGGAYYKLVQMQGLQ